MGRHGGKKARFRAVPWVFGVIVGVAVVALGLWWWNLRDTSDPIDADPQRAYAQVIESRPCTDPDPGTTVELVVGGQTVEAYLNGCGHRAGQRLAVEYLGGRPDQVRLAGTTASPATSTGKRLLPLVILAIGSIAAVAAWALVREKRRPREGTLTVAQMREAIAAGRASDAGTRSSDTGTVVAVPIPVTRAPDARNALSPSAPPGATTPSAAAPSATASPATSSPVTAPSVTNPPEATPAPDIFTTGDPRDG